MAATWGLGQQVTRGLRPQFPLRFHLAEQGTPHSMQAHSYYYPMTALEEDFSCWANWERPALRVQKLPTFT